MAYPPKITTAEALAAGRPLGDRILVRQCDVPTRSKGGVEFADETREIERPIEGIVKAIGEQVSRIKVGERVVFGRFAGLDIKDIVGESFRLMREDEVVMVFPE